MEKHQKCRKTIKISKKLEKTDKNIQKPSKMSKNLVKTVKNIEKPEKK